MLTLAGLRAEKGPPPKPLKQDDLLILWQDGHSYAITLEELQKAIINGVADANPR